MYPINGDLNVDFRTASHFRTRMHGTSNVTGSATMRVIRRKNIYHLAMVLAIIQSGCALLHDRTANAIRLAEAHGFENEVVTTGHFKLRIFHRGLPVGSGHLRVYIEGDGSAWKQKYRLSSDPTPTDPVGLELAVRDPGEAVLYIGRPCQFLSESDLSRCAPIYWSSHRYSEEVIAAVNSVIENKAGRFDSLGLIGYSGGGSVAALVAARRENVDLLMTIAANLDHRAWTALHQVSSLKGSLNAVDYIDSLQEIPQIHLAGARDDNVPFSLLKNYRDAADNPSDINIVEIDDYDHTCCWVENWPNLICKYSPVSIKACVSWAPR